MAVFARRFRELLRQNGVEVHCKGGYVDDLRYIMDSMKLGTRWVGDKLERSKVWEKEDRQE